MSTLDLYQVSLGSVGPLESLSAPTTVVAADTTAKFGTPVALPFTFPFAGGAFDTVYPAVCGYLQFTPAAADGSACDVDPQGDDGGDLYRLAAWGDDLRAEPSTGFVRYEVQGSAPDRRVIFEWLVWSQAAGFDPTKNVELRFQIALVEDGSAEFRYEDPNVTGAPSSSLSASVFVQAGDDWRDLAASTGEHPLGGSSTAIVDTLDAEADFNREVTGASLNPANETVRAWPTGEQEIDASSPYPWSTYLGSPEHWSLSYATADDEQLYGPAPRVGQATPVEEDGAFVYTVLDLDQAMVPGVSYSLQAPAWVHGVTPPAVTLTGPEGSKATPSTDPLLVDIAAPLLGPNKGGYVVNEAGDFALTSGQAALTRIIWRVLLTPRGKLRWDRTFGSLIQLKRAAPQRLQDEERHLRQLIEEIPQVTRARVDLRFMDDHLLVVVNVTSRLGDFSTQREFADAA